MALYRQSQGEIFSASQRVIFNVFGLLNEAFGDGIMNAIDLSMDTVRTPDPKGDRVKCRTVSQILAVQAILSLPSFHPLASKERAGDGSSR